MNNYIVGDFIIRLKNAALARRREVWAPYSQISEAIAKILLKEGFITDIKKDKEKRLLGVTLSYKKNIPMLSDAKLISKPGRRIYRKVDEIPRVAGGIGITIVSTPKGVLSDKDAKKQRAGGEVIAQIW